MSEVIDILKKVGAIKENSHFVGTSGLHFDAYVNKDSLYPHTEETSKICRLLAEKYKDKNVEVVVGPAMGGIILSQWVAHNLSKICGREIIAVYSEKTENGGQVLRRGYDELTSGKRVLIVEDIITTGGSLKKAVEVVKKIGGNIIGVCAMVNKNKNLDKNMFGAPFDSLADLYIETYKEEDCPLCKANIPINTEVGHGKEFLAKNV